MKNEQVKNYAEFGSISICQGCGTSLPANHNDTTIHPYMLSSPACWKYYGEVLACEYTEPSYAIVHRLTVDAYAAQHPGNNTDRRAIQSVNVHLASLYLIFEKNISHAAATDAIRKLILHHKGAFIPLSIPATLGDLTIKSIAQAKNAEEHQMLVKEWAYSTWQAWRIHQQHFEQLTHVVK